MIRPVAETAEQYLLAWRERDLDAILALHTHDSTYRLHVLGEEDATGIDAVRAAFTRVFDDWPDLSFRTIRLDVGADFFAHQMDVWGTPRGVVAPADGTVREAVAGAVHYDMVDVVRVRHGRIARKDTYVDALAIMAGTAETEVAAR